MSQVPEVAQGVGGNLHEAARTVGERAVPSAEAVSKEVVGRAKELKRELPKAAEALSSDVNAAAKSGGEQGKDAAQQVRAWLHVQLSRFFVDGGESITFRDGYEFTFK